MATSKSNLKSMIRLVEDQIVSTIKSGDFRVPPVIDFLTDHMHTDNGLVRSSVARIVQAVKDAGYGVTKDDNRYYVFKR